MNVLGVGTGELLLILLIALLVMGPERLPQLARQWAKITKMMGRVTKTWYELNAEINRQLDLEDQKSTKPAPATRPTPVPPPPGVVENTIAPPELTGQPDLNAASEQPSTLAGQPDLNAAGEQPSSQAGQVQAEQPALPETQDE